MPKRILVIQTAFIGDAILGTALLEKLHESDPKQQIDYLVREGNQSLFKGHPFLNEVLIWNKGGSKYVELFRLLKKIRLKNYDAVYNIQRFAASGFLTAFSGSVDRVGYDSNPLSFLFSRSVKHRFGKGFENVHEVDRVLDLIGNTANRTVPKLYPTTDDEEKVSKLGFNEYVTIAPASVWFTKQLPAEKWIELIDQIPDRFQVLLIGAPADKEIADQITRNTQREVNDLTGQLKLLETASLMRNAVMNYANDSAPVHLASAVNAPICEVYCSTIPEFGFSPLSDRQFIVQPQEGLDCRPCGIHGKSDCPKGHFQCAKSIEVADLIHAIK